MCRRWWWALLAAAVWPLPQAPAHALEGPDTVLELSRDCRPSLLTGSPATVREGVCRGIFLVVLALTRTHGQDGAPVLRACPPADAGIVDLVRAFVSWADLHPRQSSDPAIAGAWNATLESWPCVSAADRPRN